MQLCFQFISSQVWLYQITVNSKPHCKMSCSCRRDRVNLRGGDRQRWPGSLPTLLIESAVVEWLPSATCILFFMMCIHVWVSCHTFRTASFSCCDNLNLLKAENEKYICLKIKYHNYYHCLIWLFMLFERVSNFAWHRLIIWYIYYAPLER